MSVLIKGLDMPEKGRFIDVVILDDGTVVSYDDQDRKIAEAIELPDTIEPKKGKWIEPAAENVYRCSVCEEFTTLEMPRLFYHYCPNCGAQMDDVEKEEVNMTKMLVNIEKTWITPEKRKE